MISTLAGIFLVFLGTVECFVFVGGHVGCLVQIIPLAGIILAGLGSSVLAFGFRDVKDTLLASRCLFLTPSKNEAFPRYLLVVRYLIISNYAFGSLMFLLCSIITLAGINGPLDALGQHIAACICTFVNAILVSEVFLRPLRCRLEYLIPKQ
jgi:flagellar motor component MotA